MGYLDSLLAKEGEKGTYDFAFIDADKDNYPAYYDKLVELMRPGGFIMIDNVLWHGSIANEEKRKNDAATKAIYETTQKAMQDERVEVHTIRIGDGLLFATKK